MGSLSREHRSMRWGLTRLSLEGENEAPDGRGSRREGQEDIFMDVSPLTDLKISHRFREGVFKTGN